MYYVLFLYVGYRQIYSFFRVRSTSTTSKIVDLIIINDDIFFLLTLSSG
jgi:hypothetical protein